MPRVLAALALLAGCSSASPPCEPGSQDTFAALEAIVLGSADACAVALYEGLLEDRAERQGPWLQDIWRVPTPDALGFDLSQAERMLSGAAVPEVVTTPDGRTWLFSVVGDLGRGRAEARSGWMRTHGLVGWGALQLHVSDNGGPLVPVPEFGIEGLVVGMVVDPEVVVQPDGTWRLYYVAMDLRNLVRSDAFTGGGEPRVFFAESRDLVHWRQVGEAANGPSGDPVVRCEESGECLMVSSGLKWSASKNGGQGFRTERDEAPPGFAPELVELPDGRLRLLFNAKRMGGPVEAWVSSDGGDTWVPEGERIGPREAEALSLEPLPGGGWSAWFHAWREGYSGDRPATAADQEDDPALPAPSLPASSEPRVRKPEAAEDGGPPSATPFRRPGLPD